LGVFCQVGGRGKNRHNASLKNAGRYHGDKAGKVKGGAGGRLGQTKKGQPSNGRKSLLGREALWISGRWKRHCLNRQRFPDSNLVDPKRRHDDGRGTPANRERGDVRGGFAKFAYTREVKEKIVLLKAAAGLSSLTRWQGKKGRRGG